MALFDFLKKKKKQEKEHAHSRESLHHVTEEKDEKPEKSEAPAPVFDESRFHDDMVLIAPHITEKTRFMSDQGAFIFRVVQNATKQTVKRSIEHLYHVHVENVRMIHVPQKPRRRGLTSGSKKGYKKAIVSLRKGETIELF